MFVAGLRPATDDVLELARLVDVDLADKLQTAVNREVKVLALTVPERESILPRLTTRPTDSPSSAASCCGSTRGGLRTGSRRRLECQSLISQRSGDIVSGTRRKERPVVRVRVRVRVR
jgi:hypothetical protein